MHNMQLNSLLKRLILIIPVIMIISCNSHTNYNNKSNVKNTVCPNLINIQSNLLTTVNQQIQTLQKNNIVYFDFDKYNVCSEFFQQLNAHANFLQKYNQKVVIEGHADERGTPEYNIALGERRANSVKIYLQGKGVAENQLTIVSYGKDKPAILGHDEVTYTKNRRAVIVYLTQKS